nr:MAG TPA: hypothetical protein [Caudoviricetes sp.]
MTQTSLITKSQDKLRSKGLALQRIVPLVRSPKQLKIKVCYSQASLLMPKQSTLHLHISQP